jgi:asparagine synthase (glutamine-hydrolysing)
MCGIFSLFNTDWNEFNIKEIITSFEKGKSRGPENSIFKNFLKCSFGFHRLAINGLDNISNQPIEINNIILICNGEIFNYKYLMDLCNINDRYTNSDCEVIIHLYAKFGIEYTLNVIQGEFAFVLLDNRFLNGINNCVYIARDPFGIRPLYSLTSKVSRNILGFASEVKMLTDIYNKLEYHSITQFKPGTYSQLILSDKVNSYWNFKIKNKIFFTPNPSQIDSNFSTIDIIKSIAPQLENAVIDRCSNTDRPVACLLSGGLDSSIIAALANKYFKENNPNFQLETFSIGLKNSEDLKYAQMVADHLNTKHTQIIVTEKEMFEAIPEVIYAIESYDTTTVRASIGNYLLGKHISKFSNAKVILNGDGADELFGGYLYFNNYKNDLEFDYEVRNLLSNIHYFDVLRSDKCISSHGLEPRTPYLDKNFVNYYLSLPLYLRNHNNLGIQEKNLIRCSIRLMDSLHEKILPDEVLVRRKEAFSDGVSSLQKSLFTIIQERILAENKINVEIGTVPSLELEKKYYKSIFDNYFQSCDNLIPYFWMPKFNQTDDPSARLLDIYSSHTTDKFNFSS